MPSYIKTILSPLLRSVNKGTGVLPGSNSRQYNNKKQFRTAQLHIQRTNVNKDPGEERTPKTKEGMLHLLSLSACHPSHPSLHFPASLTVETALVLPASLTVEAALALPLFLAAMCILIFPLRVLEAQETAQMEMEKALEIVAVAEGVRAGLNTGGSGGQESAQDAARTDGQTDTNTPVLMKAFDTAVTGTAILNAFDPEVFYPEKLPSFQFPTEEDPMVTVQVSGLVRFPFMEIVSKPGIIGNVGWKLMCPVVLISSRRAWVGRKGGYGRSYAEEGNKESGEKEEEDRTVYIAANSSRSGRYHVSAVCHYLHNDLTVLTRAQLDKARNADGGKYHPCPSCHPQSCGTVYVFKSGSAYHSSPSCKAIGAYVTELKESEAKGRGLTPCSYCGRGY